MPASSAGRYRDHRWHHESAKIVRGHDHAFAVYATVRLIDVLAHPISVVNVCRRFRSLSFRQPCHGGTPNSLRISSSPTVRPAAKSASASAIVWSACGWDRLRLFIHCGPILVGFGGHRSLVGVSCRSLGSRLYADALFAHVSSTSERLISTPLSTR